MTPLPTSRRDRSVPKLPERDLYAIFADPRPNLFDEQRDAPVVSHNHVSWRGLVWMVVIAALIGFWLAVGAS